MASSTEEKFQDFPFDDMCKQAKELADQGILTFQKFTCAGCGNRLTMEVPNTFFEQGTCDNCDAVTDIKKQGCNYLVQLVFGIDASKGGRTE